MKYHGTVATAAVKHNCHWQLNFGLSTNQMLLQQRNHIESINDIKNIPVYINERLSVAAGKAFYAHSKRGMHIQLHSALIDLEDYVSQDFEDTFFHEIAHMIAYRCDKHQGHGFPWAYSMMQFGHSPTRCYNATKFNYKGHRARQVNRLVDRITNELPDFGLENNAAKGKSNDKE